MNRRITVVTVDFLIMTGISISLSLSILSSLLDDVFLFFSKSSLEKIEETLSSLLSFVSFSLLKEMFFSDETVDSTIAPTNIKNLSNMISSIQHDSVQDLFAVRMV